MNVWIKDAGGEHAVAVGADLVHPLHHEERTAALKEKEREGEGDEQNRVSLHSPSFSPPSSASPSTYVIKCSLKKKTEQHRSFWLPFQKKRGLDWQTMDWTDVHLLFNPHLGESRLLTC